MNMTKRKILTYGSIFALAIFLSSGVAKADAFWGGNLSVDERAEMQQKMFTEQANLLGISVDEVKNAWANGQNIFELAKAKGISEDTLKAKMDTLRAEKHKTQLQALVTKGVITQAQADARLKSMETMKEKMGDKKGKGRGMGHMMGMGGLF